MKESPLSADVTVVSAHPDDASAGPEPAPHGDRRGGPLPYVSYWAHRRRRQRAEVFRRAGDGHDVPTIARELGLTIAEVERVIASDRRRRRT